MAVIIYPPTIDWDWMKQRPQHLMEQFAGDGHEVYYCNKTQEPERSSPFTEVTPNLTIVHDNKHFLRNIVPQLKMQKKKIVLWITCAKHYVFAEQYFPDVVVFDYVDHFPVWAPYVEDMLIQTDIVFAASRTLQEQIKSLSPIHRCELIPNGVNPDQYRFDQASAPPVPEDFPSGEGPVIGFAGAWSRMTDRDLFERIAQSFPDTRIVIIGAEFGAKATFSSKNIHYLGFKTEAEMPAYLHQFHACILPFKLNGTTQAANPLMMYEYLAAGKPVVSTDLPEARDIPEVYIANSHDHFIAQLAGVLAPDYSFNRETVDHWLAENTWRRRYELIRTAMTESFPNLMADQDGSGVKATELEVLMERVVRKMEAASILQPALLASYLRGLDQSLTFIVK